MAPARSPSAWTPAVRPARWPLYYRSERWNLGMRRLSQEDMRHQRSLTAALLLLGPLAAEASSLDKELIRGIIRGRQPEYRRCYEGALRRSPGLHGRLVLVFTVEADGEVSAATERAPPGEKFPDEMMTGCIFNQIRQLRFPSGPARFHITYPMTFSSEPNTP